MKGPIFIRNQICDFLYKIQMQYASIFRRVLVWAQDLTFKILSKNFSPDNQEPVEIERLFHRSGLGGAISWFSEQGQQQLWAAYSSAALSSVSFPPFPSPRRSLSFQFQSIQDKPMPSFYEGMVLCYNCFKNGTKSKHFLTFDNFVKLIKLNVF